MKIRFATTADFETMSGAAPHRFARAIAAEDDDGQVVALAGVYPENTRYVMFSMLTDRFRSSRRDIVQGIHKLQALLEGLPPMPVVAFADEDISGSEQLLAHMGFANVYGRVHEWRGSKPLRR